MRISLDYVLDYEKMEVGGGEGSHTATGKTFLNAVQEANKSVVSIDYWLSAWPLNNQKGCQFNSNLCKMLIGTRTIPIRELKSHLHSE